MADVKVCDRCGIKLSDEKRSSIRIGRVTRYPVRYAVSAWIAKPWNNYKPVRVGDYDLCESCADGLCDYLTGRELCDTVTSSSSEEN